MSPVGHVHRGGWHDYGEPGTIQAGPQDIHRCRSQYCLLHQSLPHLAPLFSLHPSLGSSDRNVSPCVTSSLICSLRPAEQ